MLITCQIKMLMKSKASWQLTRLEIPQTSSVMWTRSTDQWSAKKVSYVLIKFRNYLYKSPTNFRISHRIQKRLRTAKKYHTKKSKRQSCVKEMQMQYAFRNILILQRNHEILISKYSMIKYCRSVLNYPLLSQKHEHSIQNQNFKCDGHKMFVISDCISLIDVYDDQKW